MINPNNLREKLKEVGFSIHNVKVESRIFNHRFDFIIHTEIDKRKYILVIEVKERPHLVDLRLTAERAKHYTMPDTIPIIASNYMGPNRRELLKQLGVGYIDMLGNIYMRAPGILIDREGKENHAVFEREGLNPYSDKASIILRILLNEPNKSWRIREIAKTAEVNPGWASRVVNNLVERGLVEFNQRQGVILLRGEDATKEWADIYDWHRNKFYYYYCHALNTDEIIQKICMLKIIKKNAIALGFHAGAYLASKLTIFNEVHLILDGHQFDVILPEIETKLQLDSRKEGANLIIVRPYYKYSALFGIREIKKCPVVSDIQLYLDLIKYPKRGQEQAEHIWNKLIQPKFRNII